MPEDLPIVQALPELRYQLSQHTRLIVQAPPGAGKSTLLPLALLEEPWLGQQKILMLEPRRLAARSVAARMADLRGEALGQTVGYRVRFESRVGPQTRLEVLTEGILTRRLQNDPTLEGVGAVLFDEFHERSLHADLALALCLEVQQALRPDLRLLLMSATFDGEALSRQLAAPIVSAVGRQYPVDLKYLPKDLEVTPATVAAAVSRALAEQEGDVLVFLPGVSEIQRTLALVQERHPEVKAVPLYGELALDQQQAALLPDPNRRKVVLATSIAETSLTIEGIRAVVDSGLARLPRFDSSSGLTRLETLRLTRDSADQRAGRAGRLGPGVAYRLWSALAHTQLSPQRKPEILEADLAPMLLELAQWGVAEPSSLQWVTSPAPGALRQARALLEALGALQGSSLTPRGKGMLELPTHPRLAHMLLEAVQLGSLPAALACDLAALLEERDPLRQARSADLNLRVEALRQARTRSPKGDFARVERLAAEWRQRLRVEADPSPPDPYQVGLLLSLAYPDRIAKLREGQSLRYRLSGGRGVRLSPEDPLQGQPWLAVAHLDAGSEEGRIHLAAPLHPADLEAWTVPVEVVQWNAQQGVLQAQLEHRIGQLALRSEPLKNIPEAQRSAVLLQALRSEGLGLLAWSEGLRQWQARVLSLRQWRGADWPEVSDAALLETLEGWLAPHLGRINRREDFAKLDLAAILSGLLPWPLPQQLEALAPQHLEVPSGSRVRLEYFPDGAPPVLAVKLQEMFGLADTPTVNQGRTPVMLHLLSPAQRPIQVTQDLRSFWQNTYPEVRKELRGRYNKHPWPEDPWNALPTKKTNRALGRG